MFDETTDVSNTTQLSLNIRYTDDVNIFESFVGFIDLRKENLDTNEENAEPKMTGIKVGKTVIKALENLNLKNCIAITTDGCSTMVSEVRGAVRTVQQEAVYSHCYNHALIL